MFSTIFSCSYFTINSYGVCAFFGIALSVYFWEKEVIAQKLIPEKLTDKIALQAILSGLIVSRAFHVISEFNNYTNFWEIINITAGGLSILGAIIGILLYAFIICIYYNLLLTKLTDIVALYAPISQSIGRIGCFLAGCCSGTPTTLFWAINSYHPTQIYSAILLIFIFIILYHFRLIITKMPGRMTLLYLILSSTERLIIDFWRSDRIMINKINLFSFNQLIALVIIITASITLTFLTWKKRGSGYEYKSI